MAKPNTLPVEQTTAAALHQELTQWRREESLWVDELSVWHKEHEVALEELAKLEQAYHRLADAVSKVREELTEHQQKLHAHDRVLAEFLQGEEALSIVALQQQHQAVKAEHVKRQKELAQTEELFKKMVAKMEIVRRALAE